MNTNPEKYVGKIKEQIGMEFKARRNYPRKWSKFYNETPWNDMYNPNNLSNKLKEETKAEDFQPYQQSNEGDGYFISPDMYKSLLTQCRCGRLHNDLHLLRCVQKEQSKYPPKEEIKDATENNGKKNSLPLPKTSSAFVGWHSASPKYEQWEKSIKYISPVYDMPGERITTTPYNAIIIG